MRQLEVSACRSGLVLTLKRSASMLQRGSTAQFKILRLNRFQADCHQTEDTWMDREIVQSELTCQPVRGISGYNGEYDT